MNGLTTKLYLAKKRGLKCQNCGAPLCIKFMPQWEDIPHESIILTGNKKDRSAILHHSDKDCGNNKIENMILVCGPCHWKLHGRKDPSIYLPKPITRAGLTMAEVMAGINSEREE